MKKFNGARMLSVLSMVFFLGGALFLNQNMSKSEDLQMEEDIAVEAEHVTLPYEYIIVEEDGYLVVYCSDRKTIYFQTDIRYAELNQEIQEKIRNGYGITDVRELYDFLENYSS